MADVSDVRPDILAELERRGVDSVRALLGAISADGITGTGRRTQIRLGDVDVSRADIEDWLKSKDTATGRWIRTGAIAAILAAILTFLAWLFPIR